MPVSFWVKNLFILISLDSKYADYQLYSKEFLCTLEMGVNLENCSYLSLKSNYRESPLLNILFRIGPSRMFHTWVSLHLLATLHLDFAR